MGHYGRICCKSLQMLTRYGQTFQINSMKRRHAIIQFTRESLEKNHIYHFRGIHTGRRINDGIWWSSYRQHECIGAR